MKKIILVLCLLLAQSVWATQLSQINYYLFDYVNWSLVTQVIPLSNGNYVVQKYGKFLTLFNSQGEELNEYELGVMTPIYQKGHSLKNGEVVFIQDDSVATFFDSNLKKLREVKVPAELIYSACSLDNGSVLFLTFRDEALLRMDTDGNFERIPLEAERSRVLKCLDDNKAFVYADSILSIFDFTSDTQLIYEKVLPASEDTLKVMGEEIFLMLSDGLFKVNYHNLNEVLVPLKPIPEYSGIDYFSDGRFVTLEATRNSETGNYDSEMILYSAEGEKLNSFALAKTGASSKMPVSILKDKYIISDFCAYDIILFDSNLSELDRFHPKQWMCSDAFELTNGDVVFFGFEDSMHAVYQLRLTE